MITFSLEQRADLRGLSPKEFSVKHGFSFVFSEAIRTLRDQDGWAWPNGQMGKHERRWREWESDRQERPPHEVKEVKARIQKGAEAARLRKDLRGYRRERGKANKARREKGLSFEEIDRQRADWAYRKFGPRWLSRSSPLHACAHYHHDMCQGRVRNHRCGCPCHTLMELGVWEKEAPITSSRAPGRFDGDALMQAGRMVRARILRLERQEKIPTPQKIWADFNGLDDELIEALDELDRKIRPDGFLPMTSAMARRNVRRRRYLARLREINPEPRIPLDSDYIIW